MIVVGRQCLNIRGKDTFILSGAMHYARCPKPLWRDRLAKMKEAGLNCIDYYIPWNYHERDQPTGLADFSKVDLSELRAFLSIVHDEFDFYSMARPGPYICAEWAGGGFPWWLLTKKPKDFPADQHWVRSADPTYLAWSKHWYDAVCPIIAAEQLTRKPAGKGGVILFQIENEYDFFSSVPAQQRIDHLKALANDARRNGIEVPLMTCWTKECRSNPDPVLKDVFDGPNMYPRWNMAAVEERLKLVKQQQPDAPGMVPELQGGWFSGVGGVLSEDQPGIESEQIHHLTLMAMMNDATILNYYMFFGGTNFGLWAGRNVTTTYDYNAPLRECGGAGERFLAVKAIGRMLATHGEALAGSQAIIANVEGIAAGVSIRVRKANNGSLFIFVRNATSDQKIGHAKVMAEERTVAFPYELAPRDFKLMRVAPDASAGTWIIDPPERIERPATTGSVRLDSAFTCNESPRGEWRPVASGHSLPEMGIYDARTVLYRAAKVLTMSQLSQFDALWVDLFQDDHVVLQLNGRILFPTGNYRGSPAFNIRGVAREGENEFIFLHENKGHLHYGGGLEWLCGIRSALLTSQDRLSLPILQWRAKLLAGAEETSLVPEKLDDSDWPSFSLDQVMADRLSTDLQPGTETDQDAAARTLFRVKDKCVFRSTFTVSDEDLRAGKTRLVTQSIEQNATVYLNGQKVGFTPAKPAKFLHELSASLRAGQNTLAIVVENVTGFQAGLFTPVYLEGKEIAGEALALECLPDFPSPSAVSGGEVIALDTKLPLSRRGHSGTAPAETPEALAKTYRMEFELPEQPKDIRVPWRALIDASGNGMIHLNGHCLGRYWEAGPQREYYLPECWLHFGAKQKNILTLCLRSTQRGAKLRAAEIAPYTEFAEWRQ